MFVLLGNYWLLLHYIIVVVGLFCQHSFGGEVLKSAPNKINKKKTLLCQVLIHLKTMLKAPGKSEWQTGTKILLEAMSKDKIHLARFVLDALDGKIVDSKTGGAQTLISSILLPDSHIRCKFAELLLQRGAGVNSQDANGRTALSYACEKGYLDAVQVLVRNNADPEIADCWGNTALMYAAVAGHASVVEFLVRVFKRLGLQIDRQNKAGNSAAEVAKFLGHTECILALTNTTKRGRESEAGARANALPRLSLDSNKYRNDKFWRKAEHLVNKPEGLPTCNHTDCFVVQHVTWQPRPRIKPSRLPSMDSIEEFARENDCSSAPQELLFSGILTPKPPPRNFDDSSSFSHLKTVEKQITSDDHLRFPTLSCEAQKSIIFSPRPNRNTTQPGASSALGILLTPIRAHKSKCGTEKSKMPDFVKRRFHDSYYKKRCSLPTSILSPTPPDRTVPFLKSRTVKRREAGPCKADAFHFSAADTTTSTTTFSTLSNKLLRRFTSPEFKKDVKELEEDPVTGSGRIPRSETFPQDMKHPQVGSKPSIDSISSVKCEFDFYFRTSN